MKMDGLRLRREELEKKELQLRLSFEKFEKFLKVEYKYIKQIKPTQFFHIRKVSVTNDDESSYEGMNC